MQSYDFYCNKTEFSLASPRVKAHLPNATNEQIVHTTVVFTC